MLAKQMREKKYYRYANDFKSLITPIDKLSIKKLLGADVDTLVVFDLEKGQMEVIDENCEVLELSLHFEL